MSPHRTRGVGLPLLAALGPKVMSSGSLWLPQRKLRTSGQANNTNTDLPVRRGERELIMPTVQQVTVSFISSGGALCNYLSGQSFTRRSL